MRAMPCLPGETLRSPPSRSKLHRADNMSSPIFFLGPMSSCASAIRGVEWMNRFRRDYLNRSLPPRRWVKQHHGVFRVQSQPGQGTTFLLYFSAVEPKTEAAEEQELLEAQAVLGGSETILLVEDDPDIQLIMSEMLREYGYTVLIANDGEEGLQMFEQHASSIALVIADVMMPRMQGRQFQEHVRRQRADTKVLVMSGYQEMDLKRRNLLNPGSAFLESVSARSLRETAEPEARACVGLPRA